jgi:hypothetical protein
MSIAAIALIPIAPGGKKPPRAIDCHRNSMRLGSAPIRNCLRCSIVPANACSFQVSPPSPTPEMPSSVSTTTKL